MIMRIKWFALVFFAVFTLKAIAQSDPSEYLNLTLENLKAGDCLAAQRFYNVYQTMTGESISYIEKAISDCQPPPKKRTYYIGDDAIDFVGEEGFKIAYLDSSRKHGFAIKISGRGGWPNKSAPSLDDCKILYNNRRSLGLSGEYWTKDPVPFWGFLDFYTYDFSKGKRHARSGGKGGSEAGFIEVRRF